MNAVRLFIYTIALFAAVAATANTSELANFKSLNNSNCTKLK